MARGDVGMVLGAVMAQGTAAARTEGADAMAAEGLAKGEESAA